MVCFGSHGQKHNEKDTDLTLTVVIKIGYDCGLVESKTLSIRCNVVGIEIYPSEKRKDLSE